MEPTPFANPRRLLLRWALAWSLGLALWLGYQLAVHQYVRHVRATSPWTYLRAAANLDANHDWMGALAMLEEAARRDPASPVPYERAGLLYYERGNLYEKALEQYREALQRGSKSVDVRGKIIWCLIHLKRYRAAAEFGEVCIKEGIDSPYFPRFVAEAYRRAEEHAAAIPYWEEALKRFPNDLYLLERLSQSYKAVGETGKAEGLRQRIEAIEGRLSGAAAPTSNP